MSSIGFTSILYLDLPWLIITFLAHMPCGYPFQIMTPPSKVKIPETVPVMIKKKGKGS
jgi:hypothetical protein